jgi:hypothetical protein
MRGPSPRFLFNASLVGLLITVQGGVVLAQIPKPIETAPAVSEPVAVPIVTEEPQAAVDTPQETVEQVPAPVEPLEEPVGLEEMVTTVEEAASVVAESAETLVGQVQETAEPMEQTAAAVEETVASTEVTAAGANDPVDGGEVASPVETQEGAAQSPTAEPVVEQTPSEAAAPVQVAATEAAGPIDAVEALGGAFQETVTAVEETAPELVGPIDAVEALGGAFQETVTTVEGAGQEIIAAVASLEGQIQMTVDTVEATAQEIVDSVGTLQLQIEETVNSAEQTVDEVDALQALGGEIHETITVVEETAQGIVAVLEVLDTKVEETVISVQTTTRAVVDAAEAAAGETQETVLSIQQTAQQVVDLVEVLQAQIEKSIVTVEETAQVVEVIEVLGKQVESAEKPAENSTQAMVDTVHSLVAEIESSLSPVQETAPQIVVAVEGLVGKIEESMHLVDVTQIESSAVTQEVQAVEVAGPLDAVEVLGGGEVALRGPISGESLVRAPSADPLDTGAGLNSVMNKDVSGLSSTTAPEGIAAIGDAAARSLLRASPATVVRKTSTVSAARSLLNWTAILGASQPSLAILVDALNDADGDGIFSDAEIAAAPGTDVNLKVLITNIGAVSFEIDAVTHSYNGGTEAARGEVCGELVGLILAPGESLACTFPMADYSPPAGESLINTVMAAGFEIGKGSRRGAADSDTSTVQTIVADEDVLAVALKRNLAFTGTEAARLVALGLLLLAAGGGLLSLARLRTRPPSRPLPSESPTDLLGWWAAGPSRSGSTWKVGRR